MNTLTNNEAVRWINDQGIFAQVQEEQQEMPSGESWKATYEQIEFQPDSGCVLRILLRDVLYYRLTNLAAHLLPYRGNTFQSCLLWFTDWGMWNDHHERVAYRLLNLLRAAHDEKRPLIEAPGHLFDEAEVVDAQTMLTTAMVASWDVYMIPSNGEFLVHNSHHEYVDVISKTAMAHKAKFDALREWGAQELEYP
jgi:hypothetical protein